jgi:3-oxoacyl-[acyl-carrier-protein] synthase III
MLSNMNILRILTATPPNHYSTEELLEEFPCPIPESVRKNVLNLGVSRRSLLDYPEALENSETILSEDKLVNLCTETSLKAIESYGILPGDVDYFIAAYDVNPFLCPGLSQLLIPKIGLDPYIKHLNIQGMACTAFTKALELAKTQVIANPEGYVLICISGVNSYWFYNQIRGLSNIVEVSKISSIKNPEKREMELRKWIATMEFFLFGDGVASILVAKEEEGLAIQTTCEVTNLTGEDYLLGYGRLTNFNKPFTFGLYTYLDKRIPEYGVKYLKLILKKLETGNNETPLETAKKLAIHTGSEKILHLIANSHKIPLEKLQESILVLKEQGNLAGASLPFILQKILSETKLGRNEIILTLGYGWGFSASACSLKSK